MRLDQFLTSRFSGHYSRTYFQDLIAGGLVLVNGVVSKKRTLTQVGDEIEVEFAAVVQPDLAPEAIPLAILYEDEFLLAINKPVGLVVHPAPGNWTGTFVHALLYHCQGVKAEEGDLRPGIVHRLDKETSGVLLAAKTAEAQRRLIEAFASRRVRKEYWAITLGNPGERTIEAPIGRDSRHRQKMAIVSSGRPALSHVYPLWVGNPLTLVRVVPVTGRTHQIRVHLASCQTPILGDVLYGRPQVNQKFLASRQMLHARRLQLEHPITGKLMVLEAPIPGDFAAQLPQELLP